MILFEIRKMVGEEGGEKLWDAINWICREYPGDYDSPKSDEDTDYIDGENSYETEFGDISVFADAADALKWEPEITLCSGCGQEQRRQYKVGQGSLSNNHIGDGWYWGDYDAPLTSGELCYDCGNRFEEIDEECHPSF